MAPTVLTLEHLRLQAFVGFIAQRMERLTHPALAPALQQLCITAQEPVLPLFEVDSPSPNSARNMEGVRQAIAMLSQLSSEIKTYLCRTYSAVCTIANQIEELAMEDRYIHSRLSCLESRMEDMDRNIIELMGKVDSIKADTSGFACKTHCSIVQEAPTVNQEMLDAASVQQQKFS